jgi:hypothetical protein
MRRKIHGTEVIGVEIDEESRCAHYHSERDIIPIKFKMLWQPDVVANCSTKTLRKLRPTREPIRQPIGRFSNMKLSSGDHPTSQFCG